MIYASVCSGIEAASVAWGPLGWKCAWVSEIEPFPCAVLKHRFPEIPNLGDMNKIKGEDYNVETAGPDGVSLLVGGTPCQSFSVAGLRGGMADSRGILALTFCRLADAMRPRWVLWENVPGVLSADGGRAFGSILGALADIGYGCAWRMLDAQYFGVPQRRKRIFLVGHLGDWRPAAAVLFERESVCWDTAEGGEAGKRTAPTLGSGPKSTGGPGFSNQELFSQRGDGLVTPDDYYESHPNDSRVTGPHPKASSVVSRYGTGGNNTPLVVPAVCRKWSKGSGGPSGDECQNLVVQETFSVREDGTKGNFSATPIDKANALGALRPGEQSHHAQPFIVEGYRKSRRAQDKDDAETWVKDGKANTLNVHDQGDIRSTHAVVAIQDAREMEKNQNGLGVGKEGGPAYTVDTTGAQGVAFTQNQRNEVRDLGDKAGAVAGPGTHQTTYIGEEGDTAQVQWASGGGKVENPTAQALRSGAEHSYQFLRTHGTVRRLTPRECERLQGFPDDFTLIPWKGKPAGDCPDSPRYKALGNSMAVPCMRWIGERIEMVDKLLEQRKEGK